MNHQKFIPAKPILSSINASEEKTLLLVIFILRKILLDESPEYNYLKLFILKQLSDTNFKRGYPVSLKLGSDVYKRIFLFERNDGRHPR